MKDFTCWKRKADPIKFGSGGTVWCDAQRKGDNVYLCGPVVSIEHKVTHLIGLRVLAAEFDNEWEIVT